VAHIEIRDVTVEYELSDRRSMVIDGKPVPAPSYSSCW